MTLNRIRRIVGNWTCASLLVILYLTVAMVSIFGLAVVFLSLPIWIAVSVIRLARARETSTAAAH